MKRNATRRPFLWDAVCTAPRATYPDGGFDITLRSYRPKANCPRCRPYSVLLPVGFTMPSPLPATRCALTAPFHPYSPSPLRVTAQQARGLAAPKQLSCEGGRFVLCGTFPGVAPAGRYPAPYVDGARTFLPRSLSTIAGAAVRPTDAASHAGWARRRQAGPGSAQSRGCAGPIVTR